MKKLVFRQIGKDTLFLFMALCLSLGIIVWTLQAVNYLDFVTQDGHGFKTYLLYSLYSFPKIIHRLVPFAFFISLFLILTNYEKKNELIIFWANGVSKINFAKKILFFSFVLMIFQIIIGCYLSPQSQLKSRMILKESDVNYFSSLIKEGKFINAVNGLTIFIQKKENNNSFGNIFIDDSTTGVSKMTYAKNGEIFDANDMKIFKLFNGSVINKTKNKINVFKFDQININLSEYSTNTILVPKVQETSTQNLLKCSLINYFNKKQIDLQNCNPSIKNEINTELFKRIYKPIYIPIIAVICCFLTILPGNHNRYKFQLRFTFLFGFTILVLSETTLRYSSISFLSTFIYLVVPLVLFILTYLIFLIKSKNV
tara:strand:+ start:1009 stop:2118 length:1110 start_codon:yes stop_codon:yes gene_type:complete